MFKVNSRRRHLRIVRLVLRNIKTTNQHTPDVYDVYRAVRTRSVCDRNGTAVGLGQRPVVFRPQDLLKSVISNYV